MERNWRKSSYSSPNGDNCVEVDTEPDGGRAVRDGKLGDDSPVLTFNAAEWQAFTAGVKDDEF